MPFAFVAGRPVLDFVATRAERTGAGVDQLLSPPDLAAWTSASGLIDTPADVDVDALAHARRVREAAFALVAARIDGSALPPADLAVVNAAATRPRPLVHLDSDGRLRRAGDLDAVLAALAVDCLELYAGAEGHLLRRCADPACGRPFVDRSRSRRRWCATAGCGDGAGGADHRERQRAASA